MSWIKLLPLLIASALISGCMSGGNLQKQEVSLPGLLLKMPVDYREWNVLSPSRDPGFETDCDLFIVRSHTGPSLVYPGVGVDYRIIPTGFSWEEEAVEEALEPHHVQVQEQLRLTSFKKKALEHDDLIGISYSWERRSKDKADPPNEIVTSQKGMVFLHPGDSSILIKIFYKETSSPDRDVHPSLEARTSSEYVLTHFQTQPFSSQDFLRSCIVCSDDYQVVRASNLLQMGSIQASIVIAKQILVCSTTKNNWKLKGDSYLLLTKGYRLKGDLATAARCAQLSKTAYMEASYPLGVACALVEEATLAQVTSTKLETCELLHEALLYYKRSSFKDPTQAVPIYIIGISDFGELIPIALAETGCNAEP